MVLILTFAGISSANDTVTGIYNVKTFGAVGDGIVNDTVAVQAALDAADASGGGEVYFPAGDYYIIGLTVGSKTTITGAGPGSRLYFPAGANAIINKNAGNTLGNSDIVVKDITIDLAGTGKNGITLAGVSRGRVDNVRIISPSGYGIWLVRAGDSAIGEGTPTKHVVINNCYVTGVTDVGIEFSGSVGCTAIGNIVTGTRGIGGFYAWNGAYDCSFIGNVSEGEGINPDYKGYAIQGVDSINNPAQFKTQTQRIEFIGNVARNVRHGLRLKGDIETEVLDILIKGNEFYGQGVSDTGIDISYAKRVTVQGNQLNNFYYPLYLNNVAAGNDWDGAKYIYFDGNTIYGGKQCIFYGNIGGSFSNNKLISLSNHAFQLYACKNCNINGNIFVNLGVNSNASCIALFSYNPGSGAIDCTGNNIIGNKAMDDREIKYMTDMIILTGAADFNIVMSNNAHGLKPGAWAVKNIGTGVNNVIVNNINAQ